MNIKENEVYSFKLNSGEELIAKVIKVADSFLTLEEPVSVAPGPQGVGLIPSMFTADPKGETKLNTNSIAIISQTEDGVKTKYIQATTGIAVPSKKLVLG